MHEFDPYQWQRLQGLLVERVQSLPEPEYREVMERIKLEPFTFSSLRREGGWIEFFVGTDKHGPPISIGRMHLSALAQSPGAVN